MNKKQLSKNRLDIEYKFESQKAILCLTVGTVILIGFLATMISQKQYVIAGVLGLIIFLISQFYYGKIKRKLNSILENIEKLT